MSQRLIVFGLLSFALCSSAVNAQEERIDLDWIFSDEGRTAMATPRRAWLDADTVILYDTTLPK